MITTITKLTSSMGLALCLGLALMPLGCGGSQEMSMDPIHGGGEGPSAPEATVSELTDCANKGRARLTDTSYAVQFDVEVTESGHAGRVKLRDSYPGDRGIESCMHARLALPALDHVVRLGGQPTDAAGSYAGAITARHRSGIRPTYAEARRHHARPELPPSPAIAPTSAALGEEIAVGDPWEVKVPTHLVKFRESPGLPAWAKDANGVNKPTDRG